MSKPSTPHQRRWIWHLYRREGQLSSFLFWESFLGKVMGRILGPHFLKCLYSPESELPLKCMHVPMGSKSLWSSYYLFHHKLPSKGCIAAQDPSFHKIVSGIPSCAEIKIFSQPLYKRVMEWWAWWVPSVRVLQRWLLRGTDLKWDPEGKKSAVWVSVEMNNLA